MRRSRGDRIVCATMTQAECLQMAGDLGRHPSGYSHRHATSYIA